MEASKKRQIKDGQKFDQLFPKAEEQTSMIRHNANVSHTVKFIPEVVTQTLHHTKALAQYLKQPATYESCAAIWRFVYDHIAYTKDRDGYEEIRSPARTWHDRKQGVDCDCYSVFISSILSNLQIPHLLRITKYHRDYFQHIYPVVLLNGKEIIIDCVTDQFNYEVPYSEKKDYPMDLHYLSGFDDDFNGFGKIAKKAAKKTTLPAAVTTKSAKKGNSILQKLKAGKSKSTAAKPAAATAKKKGIKNILNKVNKINPATVLLRNGILASMKLNIKNVAGRLRWSYLTPEQATAKNIDPAKFQRLIAVRQKLENIFYGAGGKPENLKKAILSGKGNKDKAVNGLNGYGFSGVEYMNTSTTLPQLLGPDVYTDENDLVMGQLGEPITLATIAAATGVISGIIAALKQIGDIFVSKTKGSEDFDEQKNQAAENNQPTPDTTTIPTTATNPLAPTATVAINTGAEQDASLPAENNTFNTSNAMLPVATDDLSPSPASTTTAVTTDATNTATADTAATDTTNNAGGNTADQSFWDKNKSWLKPVLIGAGGLSLVAIGFTMFKPGKKSSPSPPSSLGGLPNKRKKHHRKSKPQKRKHTRKKAIALL